MQLPNAGKHANTLENMPLVQSAGKSVTDYIIVNGGLWASPLY